ncbi:hypothetical protein D3C75_1120430 [compost metagenome]
MNTDQLRITDFNTQVATSNHDYVGGQDNIVHRGFAANGFCTFDFSNNLRVTTCITRQTASVVNVFTTARERNRQIINADFCRSQNVCFVFVGQRFSGQAATQLVDTFIVRQRATHGDFCEHFHTLNFKDF